VCVIETDRQTHTQNETEREKEGAIRILFISSSAGIGRTGCFIATSIGIQQLQHEHMVDILGTVCSMRLDR